MKILQFTFTYGNNLGAMLQAYALNKVLTDMGNDCYFQPFFEKPFELPKSKLSLKDKILCLLRYYKKRNYTDKWFSNFNHFLYDRCKFAPFVEFDKLQNIQNEYDMFLVGSDQAWNIQNYNNEYCLLKWVSDQNKRCSYAVSLGNYSIRLKNDPVAEAIKNFEYISFREMVDYLDAKRNGIDCRMDIDLTFLLEQSEWKKLTSNEYSFLKDCVVMFGYDRQSFEFAKSYAKIKHKKLIIVNYFGNRTFPGIKIINPSTPQELLSVIQYANCVVTHSYHVFIVSLNLNTRVFVTKNSGNKTASRFETVMLLFELSNRETDVNSIDAEIDWKAFNEKLSVMRKESIAYLRSITGND